MTARGLLFSSILIFTVPPEIKKLFILPIFCKCLVFDHKMRQYGHKLWFTIIFVPRGKLRSSAVKSFKSFLTWSTCLQSFLRVNLTMTRSLFLPSRWQSSMNSGAMVQPTFWKTYSTFVSRCSSSTWQGIPTTSIHSFLTYWAFV